MFYKAFLVVILLSTAATLSASAKKAQEGVLDVNDPSEAQQPDESEEVVKQSVRNKEPVKSKPKAKQKSKDDAKLAVEVSRESTKKEKSPKAPSDPRPKNATAPTTTPAPKKNRVAKTPKPIKKPERKPNGSLLNDRFFKEDTKPSRHLPKASQSYPKADSPVPSSADYPEANKPPATTTPAAQGLKKDDIQNLFGDMAKPARRKKDNDAEEGRAAKGNPAKDMFAGMTGGMFGGLGMHQDGSGGGAGGGNGGLGGLGGLF